MGKNAEGSVGACVDGSQCSSATASHGEDGLHETEDAARAEVPKGHLRSEPSSTCVDKEPSLPLGEPPYGVGMLYKFLGQANSQISHPLPACFTQKGEGSAQSHSEEEEEEYEEDVIEPRTLNEITTMTDRTSPWSSLVSEPEHDPAILRSAGQLAGTAEHALKEGSVRSSPVSSVTQDDPLSVPSSARSSNSPLREDGDDGHVRRRDLEGSLEELLPPAPIQTKDGVAEERREDDGRVQEIGGKIVEEEPFIPCGGGGDGDFAAAKPRAPETGEGKLGLESGPRGEERRRLSEDACLRTVGAEQHSGSCSDESHEDLPEESEKPLEPSVVLSDPVVVPNFFLPPQDLEASMRLLSITPPTPMAAAVKVCGGFTGEVGRGTMAPP
ncbi:Hypothetical predicted protein, partial [Podarcis lilfordi]